MRTPIRCGAAAGSGSFTTVSAIGSRGHIAVPKGQYGRGVVAVLSTTIDNVGLSFSFTYTPQSPLIVTRYFLTLGGLVWLYFPTKSGTGGAKVQPVHTQKLRCLLGIGRGANEVWAACQSVRDHYVGGWSVSHVYRGGTCTAGPTCGIGRWWAAVLITMIATVSNYCMNTILEVLNVSCA